MCLLLQAPEFWRYFGDVDHKKIVKNGKAQVCYCMPASFSCFCWHSVPVHGSSSSFGTVFSFLKTGPRSTVVLAYSHQENSVTMVLSMP